MIVKVSAGQDVIFVSCSGKPGASDGFFSVFLEWWRSQVDAKDDAAVDVKVDAAVDVKASVKAYVKQDVEWAKNLNDPCPVKRTGVT